MEDALAANARTKVVFACSPQDALGLERHFEPHLTSHDLHSLGAFQAACRPCIQGGHGPAFTFRTEPVGRPERSPDEVRRASAARFAYPRWKVEDDIAERHRNAPTDLLPESSGVRELARVERRSESHSGDHSGSHSGGRSGSPSDWPASEVTKPQEDGGKGAADG
jgi:hypothetical protein